MLDCGLKRLGTVGQVYSFSWTVKVGLFEDNLWFVVVFLKMVL